MNKLTKQQQTEKQQILDELGEAKQKAQDALEELDTVREKAKDFVADVLSEMERYYDAKSEKWQEGDNGQQYSSWKDQWDEAGSLLDEAVPTLEDVQSAIDQFDGLASDPQSV